MTPDRDVPRDSDSEGSRGSRLRQSAAVVLWCALVTGLLEVGMLLRTHFQGASIHLGQEFFWMTPAADLLLFIAVAVLVVPAYVAFRRQRTMQFTTTVFVALGAISVLMHIGWMAVWARWILALGTGVQLGRLAEERKPDVRRMLSRTLPALVVLTVSVGVAGHVRMVLKEHRTLRPLAPSAIGAPNVLLVVWDAVRAEDLGIYGYPRNTTPRLDAFARSGAVFDRAFSTAPYTLPTHASLFTGLWAHQLSASWLVPLQSRVPTLAESFANRGYRTGAFSANHAYVSWEFGALRGFGQKNDYVLSWGELAKSSRLVHWTLSRPFVRRQDPGYSKWGRRDSESINTHFLDWLADGDPPRPFFAFLNVFDAHDPYLPGAPYDSLFGWPANADRGERMRVRRIAVADPMELSAADGQRLRDQYDGAIAKMDRSLGLLLDALKERGMLANTIVILTSDHGEAFGEHRMYGHGNSVYREEIWTPLAMVGPGIAPGIRVPGAASLRDLPATIGELLGADSTTWAHPGRSLAIRWTGGETRSDTILAETDSLPREGRPWFPVRRGNVRTLIAWPYQLIMVGQKQELYDLDDDPDQHHDLAHEPGFAAVRDSLTSALNHWRDDADVSKRP